MSHPVIFFREVELNKIQNEYHLAKSKIDSDVENYFSNTNSIENLYFKVGLLENKEKVLNSFKDTALAIESFGKDYVKLNTEKHVDPFSYSSFQEFDLTGSKEAFYIGIVVFILFLFSLIKKWKVSKLFGIVLLVAIGLNLYNYYVKEPEFLANESFILKPEQYRNTEMLNTADEKFLSFYQPSRKTYSSSKTYNYDVEGTDEYGDFIEGNVETSGKYGEGFIIDEYGDKIEIDTEWSGNGEMTGTDADGNEYTLKVKH